MEIISYPKEIKKFFDEIVIKVKEILDPDFILIAGSFGKESWLYSNNELVSDFEFVFVCNKPWSLKRKAQLLKNLNTDYNFEISLKGFLLDKIQKKVISNYASKNPGYVSLDFFDTFSNPVILYKKNGEVLDVDCIVNEIPVWEAWRLYVNRIGDLLKLEYQKEQNKTTANYYWLKIFESTAGAYCIINNIYHKNISKRIEVFNQGLIENDNELNEICKNSFPIIKQALLARNSHDLSLFDNKLDIKERKIIVNSWMRYIEEKLGSQEKLSMEVSDDFYTKYLNKKILQSKYLGINYHFNKLVSNMVRFIHNPNLLVFNFKFYNHKYSWRHIILLSVSSAFNEISLQKDDFPQTKKIINKICKTKNIGGNELIKNILHYWRILR